MKKLLKILMPAALALVAFALMPAVNVKASMPDGYVENINAVFTAPTVGDPIQVQSPNFIAAEEGQHYKVTWNMLIKGFPSEDPTYDNYQVEEGAVYEEGKDYYFEVYFKPENVEGEQPGEYSSFYAFSNNGDIPIYVEGIDTFETGDVSNGQVSYDQVVIFCKFKAKAAAEEQKEDTPAEDEKKEDTPAEESAKEETKEETTTPTELKILEGADQEVDGTGDVTIRSNGEFANFDKLLMDDKEVDPSNYDKKEGSTIVTLKAAYVASLGAGAHTVSFVYKDGSTVKTTLTLKAAGNSATPATTNTSTTVDSTPAAAPAATADVAPKTAETNNMWLYVILCMSVLGMGVTAVSIKRNK